MRRGRGVTDAPAKLIFELRVIDVWQSVNGSLHDVNVGDPRAQCVLLIIPLVHHLTNREY